MESERKRSFLILLHSDVQNLWERLCHRREDYLTILSLERTRTHFHDIFQSKYDQVSIETLTELDESTITSLEDFYREVKRLKWYLLHTEDLPAMVSDHTLTAIKKIKKRFHQVEQHIGAELEKKRPFKSIIGLCVPLSSFAMPSSGPSYRDGGKKAPSGNLPEESPRSTPS